MINYKNETTENDFYKENGKTQFAHLPEYIDENTILSSKDLCRLNLFINGEEKYPDEDIINQLKNDYMSAKKNGAFKIYKTAYNFETTLRTKNGEVINASIKPIENEESEQKWLLNYIGFEKKSIEVTLHKHTLSDFAIMDNDYLADVARFAINEKWNSNDEIKNYDILYNYLNQTFNKIMREEKLMINASQTYAAFNTGLATPDYEDIYMCFFKINDNFHYDGICSKNKGVCWKKLIRNFSPLPSPANYIERKEDIVFDIDKIIFTDSEHILIDNIKRLPLGFLKINLKESENALRLIDEIEANKEQNEMLYDELVQAITNDEPSYFILQSALEETVNNTIKRMRWNYRLAIPAYYPKADSMNLLLPMDFLKTGNAQAALVVQLTESGNYIGHTLLTMKQAYLNARLISSQEQSWLNA